MVEELDEIKSFAVRAFVPTLSSISSGKIAEKNVLSSKRAIYVFFSCNQLPRSFFMP